MSNLCDEWIHNSKVNPYTNRYIKHEGPVYRRLEKTCGPPNHGNPKIDVDCFEWRGDPSVNPKTFRHIKKTGLIYKKLEKKCGSPNHSFKRSPSPKSPKSPKRKHRSPKRNPVSSRDTISCWRDNSNHSSTSSNSSTYSNCRDWHDNPTINPETNRKIKRNGPIYKKLEKKCGFPNH